MAMVVQSKKGGEFTFIFKPRSGAKKVFLAGDFNGWNPQQKRMVKNKDGTFRSRVSLPAGEHQYKFVVDGHWINDADAERQVVNEYGTYNSLVTVG